MRKKITSQFALILATLFVFTFLGCNNASKDAEKAKQDSIKQADSLKKVAEEKEHKKHWSYEGEASPEHWKELNEEFEACGGKNQSPIDITGAVKDKALKALSLTYKELTELTILNNGHTVQINYPEGVFKLNDLDYKLAQFHFHCPSEHTVNGQSFAMEAHLVHKTADGKIAVIGLMVKEGKENQVFKAIWGDLPAEVDTISKQIKINVNQLLPAKLNYYHYEGSLTTPPCTEGVQWFVLKMPVEASKEQLAKIASIMPNHNARPVLPLNGRIIKEF